MRKGRGATDGENHLTIGGCDAVDLARRYGTPLYVLDEERLRDNARTYKTAFERLIPGSRVLYAGKALLTTALCQIVAQEGLGLDVVSGGELFTALAAGFPPEHIYFHGNNKSAAELTMALTHGVGRIVVDSLWELETLQTLAVAGDHIADVLIRLAPGVRPRTHAHVQTGQLDSKFGFTINAPATRQAIQQAQTVPNLRLRGFHCHIGSQIADLDSFVQTIQIIIAFLAALQAEIGLVTSELDLGGGLAIGYLPEDAPPSPEEYAAAIARTLSDSCQRWRLAMPHIAVEPGRSIVGDAGVTLYTVGASKEITGVRKYIAVDGGMADNPRVATYGAKYSACLANKMLDRPMETVTVAGKCCESADILLHDVLLPRAEAGDILAVFATGAYNYSMASNYNRLPRPAMVLVWQGESDIIVQRETYADLIRFDRIPERLAKAQPVLARG